MKDGKQQKGSLLIEVVAVIGLLALITPILFQQIHRRNEEIINAQIASEMRMLKDAASAYIRANEDVIARTDCPGLWDAGRQIYNNVSVVQRCSFNGRAYNIGDFMEYMVAGTTTDVNGDLAFAAEYTPFIYGYTVQDNCDANGENCEYRPVIYAVISQANGFEMANLRRASKIAALIGLEGGVVIGDDIKGMQGVWELDTEEGMPENAVVVVTSFDNATASSILKDVRWQHMQSDTAQADTVAGRRIGATDILTVDAGQNCIADYGNNTVSIQTSGTWTDSQNVQRACAPFFEVNPQTREVHLAGVIKTGVGDETDPVCSALNTQETCEAQNVCVWNATTSECGREYKLDLANESVMNDIRLQSRGGAKLSEILPTWILKEVYVRRWDDRDIEVPYQIPIPACPQGYQPAITVEMAGVSAHARAIPREDWTTSTYHSATRHMISLGAPAGSYTADGIQGLKVENNAAQGNLWFVMPQQWVRRAEGDTNMTWVDANDARATLELWDYPSVIRTYCVYTADSGTAQAEAPSGTAQAEAPAP